MMQDLAKEFKSVTKEEWLAKITKDLKGKPIEDLNWDISEGLSVSPFATVEDTSNIDNSILKSYNPDWQVGERFLIEDYKKSNKNILDALLNGVNAPVLVFKTLPTYSEFEQLFENIQVEFISTHFEFEGNIDALKFYELWSKLLDSRGLDSTFACFDFNPDADMDVLASIAEQNADYSQETIHIDCTSFYKGDQNVQVELEESISKAKKAIDGLMDRGLDAPLIVQQLYFTVAIGKSYLLEVAKLRALKLRYVELLKSYDVEPELPFLKVVFSKEAQADDEDDNLINSSSLAMCAVCGGASHLVVEPSSSSENHIRYARNIQLILKHESGFDKVADPMAGSYYVEKLTELLK